MSKAFKKNPAGLILSGIFSFLLMSCVTTTPQHAVLVIENVSEDTVVVPAGGNTWYSGTATRGGRVDDEGIHNWTNADVSFITYVRVNRQGSLKVWLNAEVPSGQSFLNVSVSGQSKKISLLPGGEKPVYAGTWQIKDTGYVSIKIGGVSKEGKVFANVKGLQLSGTAINKQTAFVKNNKGNFFYWGRRGPSVHLNYKVPEDVEKAEWFYNEVTVPKGNDVIGSYFMADGFGQGYFGMQVNSPTVRHILFSVWSPYKTNNPNEIPDDQKIQLLKKGSNVHAGKFGNEGSGGQSYLNYPWKAGHTYKFLLHGKPDGNGHTVFTAYFYPPEEGKWLLIASFKRPKTDTWLTHLYSFLENFSPRQGDKKRKVHFGNQWIRTNAGKWIELNKIKFTTDNTGRKKFRMDYAGGVEGQYFYLQNCGFFDQYTPVDTWFERPETKRPPDIDFSRLP